MRHPADKRLLLAWSALVAITLVYLVIDKTADERGGLVASTGVTVAAIALALVKLRIILRQFMDVRSAPGILRVMIDLTLVVMAVAMLSSYVVGRAVP